jgi:thiamine-monophosphate kinase
MTSAHIAMGPGSEFDIIRSMVARFGAESHGTGDDAAVLDVPTGARLVVSTDSAVENVHFRRAWLSAEEIGYRAGAAAISDLAAMGATPLGMLVALTLPGSWLSDAPALADGLTSVARETRTPILGGDLNGGSELGITVMVLGTAERPLTRAGATAGQAVWVTGRLGGPGLALEAFERGATPVSEHRARFARPAPRLREARWLGDHGATAAIDCSDGVAADAAHLAAASGVRIRLDLDCLPRVAGASVDDAARSGEEYELVVAAPPDLDAAAFTRAFGLALTAIGRVERAGADGTGLDAFRDGARVSVPRGHNHFAS